MAPGTEQEQYPQAPAQDEETPSSPPAGESTTHAAVNGATQDPSLRRKPNPEPSRAALFDDDDNDGNDNGSETSIPSDAASDQVISPSVSIPPYWSHSQAQQQNQLHPRTPGHARAVSSASAESVLPPGAITLQDNEREDEDEPTGRRSNSSELYGRDRNRACWARSVQVTDHVLVNGSTTNIGAFVVWNIRVETLNVRFIIFLRLKRGKERKKRKRAMADANLSCRAPV